MTNPAPDYVPARQVWEMFSVTDRTLDRWVADERMAFPRPTVLNRRRYFLRAELDAWVAARRQTQGAVANAPTMHQRLLKAMPQSLCGDPAEDARTLLEILREPTPEVLAAGLTGEQWRLAIDAMIAAGKAP